MSSKEVSARADGKRRLRRVPGVSGVSRSTSTGLEQQQREREEARERLLRRFVR